MDIQQVARRANVSTATVSRVLNKSPKVKASTLEHVKRVIAELDYIPNTSARNLRRGRSRILGLIVSDINNPFFPELIDNFEALARAHAIDVIFSHTNYEVDRLRQCIRRMVERNVDGIAVFTSEADQASFEFARARKLPLVLMNQDGPRSSFHNINVNHRTGAIEAVEHLYELGHRRIGFIAGPGQFQSTRDRRSAFVAAMAKCGLAVKKQWVVEGDLHLQGGYAAMLEILRSSPCPTAILSTNDVMAVGALQAARSVGLAVPGDLSIIGFDNLPVCTMVTPPLTSVDIPRRDIAGHAFRMLLEAFEQLHAEPLATPKVLTQLVVRGSTAPPAAGRRK